MADGSEEPICEECGRTVYVEDGLEHSGICHSCAQELVPKLRAALRERDARAMDLVSGVIADARMHYSEEIFDPSGTSMECKHAKWARNLLDGIMGDIRALLEEAGK